MPLPIAILSGSTLSARSSFPTDTSPPVLSRFVQKHIWKGVDVKFPVENVDDEVMVAVRHQLRCNFQCQLSTRCSTSLVCLQMSHICKKQNMLKLLLRMVTGITIKDEMTRWSKWRLRGRRMTSVPNSKNTKDKAEAKLRWKIMMTLNLTKIVKHASNQKSRLRLIYQQSQPRSCPIKSWTTVKSANNCRSVTRWWKYRWLWLIMYCKVPMLVWQRLASVHFLICHSGQYESHTKPNYV